MASIQKFGNLILVMALAFSFNSFAASDDDSYTCEDDKLDLCSMMPGDLAADPNLSKGSLKTSRLLTKNELQGSAVTTRTKAAPDFEAGLNHKNGLLAVEEANRVRDQIHDLEIILSSMSRPGIEPGHVTESTTLKK